MGDRQLDKHLTVASSFTVPTSAINVLVVDDNVANRMAFETLISSLGFTPFLASSGDEALHLATHYRFALILLDVRMPVMDGLETAAYLRRKPFARSTPILFVSAHEDTAIEVSRASLPGQIDYAFSPVDSTVLAYKVQSYVDLHLKNELLHLRSTKLTHAGEALQKLLDAKPDADPEIRQCAARLCEAARGIGESVAERLGTSGD